MIKSNKYKYNYNQTIGVFNMYNKLVLVLVLVGIK